MPANSWIRIILKNCNHTNLCLSTPAELVQQQHHCRPPGRHRRLGARAGHHGGGKGVQEGEEDPRGSRPKARVHQEASPGLYREKGASGESEAGVCA